MYTAHPPKLKESAQPAMVHDRKQAFENYYHSELDILRFFCFLLVFIHHSLPRVSETFGSALVDSGAYGMPVFFFLSSFLITELLLRERRKTGTVHINSFYLRRILRIWPLYFAFLAFCFVMGQAHLMMKPIPPLMMAFYLLLGGNWYLVLYGAPATAAIVLWSISLEEQFYLGWPWLMQAWGARAIHWITIVVFPLSHVILGWLAWRGSDPDTGIWTNTFVQMQFFALGGSLALYVESRKPMLTWMQRLGLFVGTLLTWFCSSYWCRLKRADTRISPEHACFGYFLVAIGTVCFFLMFYNMQVGTGPLARAGIYLGKISFGLYTVHYFALLVAMGAVHHIAPKANPYYAGPVLGLAMTVALAACSYKFLEKPILAYKKRFTFIESRPV